MLMPSRSSLVVAAAERIVSRWLTLLAVPFALAFQACCSCEGYPAGECPCQWRVPIGDSEPVAALGGCFEHSDGRAQGWIELTPQEGGLLSCDVSGLVEFGLAADEDWTCLGGVEEPLVRDDSGFEASGWLRFSAQDDGPQVFVAEFTYHVSSAGEETLVLQRGGRPDVVLVRCP